MFQWQTLEYEHKERTPDWFWAVGIIGAAIAATAIILHNTLFGLLIVIATFALIIHTIRAPRVMECEIDNRGVRVAHTLYPYGTLASFWIERDEEKLLLRSQKLIMPLVVIPLRGTNPDAVREYLLEFLEEEELHEPLSQRIMEQLGF